MAELNQHIASINTKLQQLLKKYEMLQKESLKQKESLSALQSEREELQLKVDQLQQQNLLLKVGATTLEPADKKELEQKINLYLRNIDKCISILSQ